MTAIQLYEKLRGIPSGAEIKLQMEDAEGVIWEMPLLKVVPGYNGSKNPKGADYIALQFNEPTKEIVQVDQIKNIIV